PSVRPEPSGAAFFSFGRAGQEAPGRAANQMPGRTAHQDRGRPEGEPLPADRRHLLGLEGMSRADLLELLDAATAWRERLRSGRLATAELRGVAVVKAFFEDSTRPRVSFELAERRLGAIPLSFGPTGSSVSKGESLLDTLQTMVAMGVDLVVVRHSSAGAPALLARHLDAGVINAGDGE